MMEVDDVDREQQEVRAGDLLERLTDCGLDQGLNEEDLYDLRQTPREPFRSLCRKLARKVHKLASYHKVCSQLVRDSCLALEKSASTEAASKQGRLDRSLLAVASALLAPNTQEEGDDDDDDDEETRKSMEEEESRKKTRLDVLEDLVQFVQASLLIIHHGPSSSQSNAMDVDLVEAEVEEETEAEKQLRAARLERSNLVRSIARALGVGCTEKKKKKGEETQQHPQQQKQRTATTSCEDILQRCNGTLLDKLPPPESLPPLLQRSSFGAKQLEQLEEIHGALRGEYTIRRQLLTRRASVTLQSLQLSRRIRDKDRQQEVSKIAEEGLSRMKDEPAVPFSELFSATQADLQALHTKVTHHNTGATKGSSTKFETSVKSVLIGKVPDRGGRVTDQRGNVKLSMPQWSARKASSNAQGHGQKGGGKRSHHKKGKGGQGQGGPGTHKNQHQNSNRKNNNK